MKHLNIFRILGEAKKLASSKEVSLLDLTLGDITSSLLSDGRVYLFGNETSREAITIITEEDRLKLIYTHDVIYEDVVFVV